MTMTTVVRRLRASKIKYMQSTWEDGRKVGQEWAAMFASYDELLRVSEGEQYVVGDCEGALQTLFQALNPDGERSLEEMLEHTFGVEHLDFANDEVFVGAFLTGAGEFFEKTKDQL